MSRSGWSSTSRERERTTNGDGVSGSLADVLRRWTGADRKQVIIDELREQGVLLEALRDGVGKDMDPFDLICHVVYDRPPLTTYLVLPSGGSASTGGASPSGATGGTGDWPAPGS